MVRGPRGSARRITVACRRTPRRKMPTSSRLLVHHALSCETHPYLIVTTSLLKAVRGVLVLLLLPHGENKRLSDPRLLLGETERVRGDTKVPGDCTAGETERE